MYVCVRMDVYVYIYVSRNVVGMCIRDIGLCVCVCVCVCVCMCVCVYVCVCV